MKNFVRTTLAAPIDAIATAIDLQPAAAPYSDPDTSGGTLTLADSLVTPTKLEIITYTGVSGSTLTGVTRGAEGTTAHSWVAGTHAIGAFTAADKTKLDGIQSGATANATDAELRDRSTHTGTQAIATVSGLQAALDSKSNTAHTHDDRYYTEAEADARFLGISAKAADADLLDGAEGSHYLDRANHTGTQPIATIAGLQAALDSKSEDKLPSALGNGGKMLRQKADETGFEYMASYRDFGLGGGCSVITGQDLNTINMTGFYTGSGLLNAPEGSSAWFYVIHMEHGGAGFSRQLAYNLTASNKEPVEYSRIKADGAWGPWRLAYNNSSAPTAEYGWRHGPTSFVSDYKVAWQNGGGGGSASINPHESSYGIRILKAGVYHCEYRQRATGTVNGYGGIGLDGSRAALEGTSKMWAHDHQGNASEYVTSIYFGPLNAGDFITAGPVATYQNDFQYGGYWYIGYLLIRRVS
jgi:hypothetical protein